MEKCRRFNSSQYILAVNVRKQNKLKHAKYLTRMLSKLHEMLNMQRNSQFGVSNTKLTAALIVITCIH